LILGQVRSYDNSEWSTFWSRGKDRNSCADQDNFFAGKHVGEDSIKTRNDETIGYIVMEGASHGQIGSMEFDFGRGFAFVAGYTQNNYLQSFTSPFASGQPQVTLVSQCMMAGLDGSWTVLTTGPTSNAFGVAVDEDRHNDAERSHAPETLDFAAFSSQGSLALVPLDSPPVENDTGSVEAVLIPNVDDAWKTIQLSALFTSAVPSCSVKYDTGNSLSPALVRVRNVQGASFEVRLQNPSNAAVSPRDVHCVIVEEGLWSLPTGQKIQAFRYTSTRTDAKGKWRGEAQTLAPGFS